MACFYSLLCILAELSVIDCRTTTLVLLLLSLLRLLVLLLLLLLLDAIKCMHALLLILLAPLASKRIHREPIRIWIVNRMLKPPEVQFWNSYFLILINSQASLKYISAVTPVTDFVDMISPIFALETGCTRLFKFEEAVGVAFRLVERRRRVEGEPQAPGVARPRNRFPTARVWGRDCRCGSVSPRLRPPLPKLECDQ